MAWDKAQLEADVSSWMENESVELTTNVDTIITMAMMTISKDVNVKALNVYDTSKTLAISTPLLAIPNVGTMLSMRSISVNISGTKYKTLKVRELTFLDEYWPDRSVTGEPKYYGEYDAANWIISPTPNANSATRIAYRMQFAKLVAPGDTNWIVTNHYDFALTSCLLEASRFVIDDRQGGLLQTNAAQYVRLRDLLNQTEKRTSRDEFRRPNVDAKNAPSAPPDSEDF